MPRSSSQIPLVSPAPPENTRSRCGAPKLWPLFVDVQMNVVVPAPTLQFAHELAITTLFGAGAKTAGAVISSAAGASKDNSWVRSQASPSERTRQ